jgi:hypothetical protein
LRLGFSDGFLLGTLLVVGLIVAFAAFALGACWLLGGLVLAAFATMGCFVSTDDFFAFDILCLPWINCDLLFSSRTGEWKDFESPVICFALK